MTKKAQFNFSSLQRGSFDFIFRIAVKIEFAVTSRSSLYM